MSSIVDDLMKHFYAANNVIVVILLFVMLWVTQILLPTNRQKLSYELRVHEVIFKQVADQNAFRLLVMHVCSCLCAANKFIEKYFVVFSMKNKIYDKFSPKVEVNAFEPHPKMIYS